MLILRMALFLAAGGAVVVAIVSSLAGFPPEIAIVRGVLAFMAISFVGYLGELIVVTAPPSVQPSRPEETGADRTDSTGDLVDDDRERRVA